MASFWSKFTGLFGGSVKTLQDLSPGRPSTLTKSPEPVRAKVQRAARNFKIKQVGLDNLRDSSQFGFGRDSGDAPEYLLAEVNTIRDIESIVARLFDRMLALAWKEGWKLESGNEKARAYIERRLYELESMNWTPIETTFRKAFDDLDTFANAFILKIRKEEFSSGQPHKLGGRNLIPIAALETLDPVTMFPIREKKKDGTVGRHIGWQQVVEDDWGSTQTKFFSLSDIIHITYRKKSSHLFGTPLTVPVADDIRSLRRNEEYMDIVSAKNAFPTYAYRIGDIDHPPEVFDNGLTEIDQVKQELDSMPPEGILVMPGHHAVDAINVKGSFVDVIPSIEYYRKRVVTGMGASLLDIGESDANTRDSANNVSQNLIDLMKDIQDSFEEKISLELFQELLLEAGERFKLDPSNKVFMIFHEIDQEAKQKRENHILNMVEKSFFTMNEGRRELGMRALEDSDYEDMYFNKVTLPLESKKLEIQGEVQIRVAKASPQPAGGTRVRTSGTSKNGTTASMNNPTNQNGPRGAAATKKTRKDGLCGIEYLQDLSSDPNIREMPISQPAANTKSALQDVFSQLRHAVLRRVVGRTPSGIRQELFNIEATIRSSIMAFTTKAVDDVERFLRDAMTEGTSQFFTETGLTASLSTDLTPIAKESLTKAVDRLFNEILKAITSKIQQLDSLSSPVAEIAAVIDSFSFRINIIARSEVATARNYGFAIAARENGIKTLDWTRRKDCSQCQQASLTIDTATLTYADVRCFVPNCGDKLKVPEGILTVIEEGTDND